MAPLIDRVVSVTSGTKLDLVSTTQILKAKGTHMKTTRMLAAAMLFVGTEISVRAGVQFDRAQILGRRLLVMLEYFHGNSPDGQFLRKEIDYFGIGAHFYYGGGGQ